MLGASMQRAGNLQQAIGNYEHALRLGPNPSASSNLGLMYYNAGRIDDAVRAFQMAVDEEPTTPVYRRNLGDALAKARQTVPARAEYSACVDLGNRALKSNARDPATIALIAICEAKLGRGRDAERHGAEALALAPTDREVLYKNAAIAALAGDRVRALQRLRDALDRGYQAQLVRDDDDFTAMRTMPEFRKLVGLTQ